MSRRPRSYTHHPFVFALNWADDKVHDVSRVVAGLSALARSSLTWSYTPLEMDLRSTRVSPCLQAPRNAFRPHTGAKPSHSSSPSPTNTVAALWHCGGFTAQQLWRLSPPPDLRSATAGAYRAVHPQADEYLAQTTFRKQPRKQLDSLQDFSRVAAAAQRATRLRELRLLCLDVTYQRPKRHLASYSHYDLPTTYLIAVYTTPPSPRPTPRQRRPAS
ncbi:hypothetical protein TgHK011_002726 [Trichoderma gracile]|nr:hypothetical protein TgHK011_002726 [Trichoderma gracile]